MSKPRPQAQFKLGSSAVRLRVLVLMLAFVFTIVTGRAFQVQVMNADAMAAEAASKITVARTVPAQRGSITGRDGQVLAATEETVDVTADPRMIAQNGKELETMNTRDRAKAEVAPGEMAEIIARFTGVPAPEIKAKLSQSESRYQILAKQVPSSTWVELNKALNEGRYVGVFRESNARRSYPMGTVASNVVGFMSAGKGLGGIEYALESQLAGVDGRETFETSPNGKIPLGNQVLTPAENGSSVELTIDPDLQWMVERRLAQQVDESGGLWGVAIVLDVETGELLSMANYPTFDSNNPGAGLSENMGNRAVETTYEPGSVQKVLTIASLLDAGLTTPDKTYSIERTIPVGSHRVSDAFAHGAIDITTRGILVRSSNVGAIVANRELDRAKLSEYMQGFGFGKKVGLGLPGEAAGSVPGPDMASYTADSVAFGYGLSMNAVQMAAAIGAVANDGVYVQPSIIKSTTSPDGKVTPAPKPESHRVISAQAARDTIDMMEQRTIYSAKSIGVPGYRTGSKTGTARISSGTGYAGSGQVASIVGVGPIEDPQVLVYVLIGRPDTSGAGITSAGPVYRDIMALALPRYGVTPSRDKEDIQLPLIAGDEPTQKR